MILLSLTKQIIFFKTNLSIIINSWFHHGQFITNFPFFSPNFSFKDILPTRIPGNLFEILEFL